MLKKDQKRGTNLYTPFFHTNFSQTSVKQGAKGGQNWQGNSRDLRGTQGNLRELKRSQATNSQSFMTKLLKSKNIHLNQMQKY